MSRSYGRATALSAEQENKIYVPPTQYGETNYSQRPGSAGTNKARTYVQSANPSDATGGKAPAYAAPSTSAGYVTSSGAAGSSTGNKPSARPSSAGSYRVPNYYASGSNAASGTYGTTGPYPPSSTFTPIPSSNPMGNSHNHGPIVAPSTTSTPSPTPPDIPGYARPKSAGSVRRSNTVTSAPSNLTSVGAPSGNTSTQQASQQQQLAQQHYAQQQSQQQQLLQQYYQQQRQQQQQTQLQQQAQQQQQQQQQVVQEHQQKLLLQQQQKQIALQLQRSNHATVAPPQVQPVLSTGPQMVSASSSGAANGQATKTTAPNVVSGHTMMNANNLQPGPAANAPVASSTGFAQLKSQTTTAHVDQATISPRPSSSSATSRIRSAVSQSHRFEAEVPTAGGDGAEGENLDMGLDADAQRERQLLDKEDDDEMDGKPLVAVFDSRSHPEVSMTSQSFDLGGGATISGVDVRNGSLDSLKTEELVDIGLSTVPNQFCTIRDAVDLKKLLLLSNLSRGGMVPSSTAVMDMYMVGKVVGVGSYGKVRAAWHRLTGSKVAIKTYDKSKLKDPAHWKRVSSEIKIMEQVSHPRIARMYEAVETPKRMHLIMECLDGGNLCSYVKQKKRLSEDESRSIFFQVLQAIDHLHGLGVAHRDIKLENVLFENTKDIKLIDFGFSTVCQPGKKLKVFCGTPSYMAPEIVRRTEYEGKPVDIWSLGIFLYALLCGCFPFRAKSYPDLYRRIARGTFQIPEELSPNVKDLLTKLLEEDADKRITAHAALKHPWLQAAYLSAPDMNRLRQETAILISDKPGDDLDEETLQEMVRFGIPREDLVRLVMGKVHSSISTAYYLLLEIIKKRRKLLSSTSSKKATTTPVSAYASSGGHSTKRPASASATGYPRSSSAGAAGISHAFTAMASGGTTQQQGQQAQQPIGIVISSAQPSGNTASNGNSSAAKIAGVMQQLAHAKLQYAGNIYLGAENNGQQQRPRSASTGRTNSQQRPLSAGVGRR